MILSNCHICDKKKSAFIKIKNSIILILFEMISLKLTKSLINFIDWKHIYAKIAFKTARIYL